MTKPEEMIVETDQDFDKREIGRRIKVMLTHRKMSLAELSRITGSDPTKAGLWVSGQSSPSALSLFRLCKALNCSASYILGLREERP